MFDIEVLIPVDELQDATVLQRYRDQLDAGAKTRHHGSRYLKETLEPYIIKHRTVDGTVAPLAETDDSRKWRVLRRFYS